jgi:hypothetical protein
MNLSTHQHSWTHSRAPLTPAQRAQDRLHALERGVAGEFKRLRPHHRRSTSGLRGRTDRVVERLKHLA